MLTAKVMHGYAVLGLTKHSRDLWSGETALFRANLLSLQLPRNLNLFSLLTMRWITRLHHNDVGNHFTRDTIRQNAFAVKCMFRRCHALDLPHFHFGIGAC